MHDPEVRALIQEVARARRTFLRVSPKEVRRILFEPRPRVESRDALSRIERHLLDVHREELARALRSLCLAELFTPTQRFRFHRSVTAREELHIPTKRENRELTTQVLRLAPQGDPQMDDASELLRQCVAGNGRDRPSVAQLASASLLIAPSDQARIYIALDLLGAGQRRSALAALSNVLAYRSSALLTSYAWENIGLVHSVSGDHEKAIPAYEQAVASHEERISPAISLFALYVQAGQKDDSLRAAKCIDDMVQPGHFSLRGYVERQSQDRKLGSWRPTVFATKLIPRIEDRIGLAARSVLNVFSS